ncbi:hypothetical protein B5E77_11130 [Lachnoclostridium sp. An131]|uniref:hypothetical protein n=1 Tax=Lachnoclostridium sp. An131 TaxID=1965555 RepID=UPI000B39D8E9|nr:hypothetical protein [Lachnoclostridium sp. An131]OUQ25627.1 hypothetical protein B5E77_11130 [Lachnoclostridium sp. An131]
MQRSRQRTLISSAGDITFTHTLYKDKNGKPRCLLDERIRLPDRERFTPAAEAKVLNEAEGWRRAGTFYGKAYLFEGKKEAADTDQKPLRRK